MKGPVVHQRGREGQDGLARAQPGRLSWDVYQGGLRAGGSPPNMEPQAEGRARGPRGLEGETQKTGVSAEGEQGMGRARALRPPLCRRL